MKVTNIETSTLVPDLNNEAFADVPKELIPTAKSHEISFQLEDCNTAVANAIRVCTIEENDWKALYVDTSQVICKEPDVLLTELCDRIGLIPINQSTPDDARFSLHASNTAASLSNVNVYSGDLIWSGGSKSGASALPFDERFRLLSLSPGKTVQINNIQVVHGHGYDNAKFSICSFEYDIMDHIDVYYLSEKEQILSHMTAVSDIAAEMKRLKQKPPAELYGKRIIVIPNTDIIKTCPDSVKNKIKNNYDIVLENSQLQPISSAVAKPKQFRMKFRFFCEVDPREVLQQTMQTLKDRLLGVKTYLDAYADTTDDTGSDENLGNTVEITVSNPEQQTLSIASVLIRNEDDVIGNLIVKTVLELDPNVGMAVYSKIHPSNRSVIVKVMHAQPIKLITDAIMKCHADFDSLQAQFAKKS
jgi:DNA-directed RNA polymerase subunit L